MPGAPRPAAFFDEIHHKIFLKAVFAQHARAERVRFAHDAEQKVLGADVAVAQLHGGGACLFNGVSRLFGKSVVHIRRLLPLPMVDRFSVSQSSEAAERVVLKNGAGKTRSVPIYKAAKKLYLFSIFRIMSRSSMAVSKSLFLDGLVHFVAQSVQLAALLKKPPRRFLRLRLQRIGVSRTLGSSPL